MFHFVFKVFGLITLALSLVLAVLDITRSITASELILTPLAQTWSSFNAKSLADAKTSIEQLIHPFLWDPVLLTVLKLPSWLVLWFLAMVLLKLGQRRETPFGRFASR